MNGWIKTPLRTEVGFSPGNIGLDGEPALSMERGTAAPTTFQPMFIVVKQSPISATAELLLADGIHSLSYMSYNLISPVINLYK